LFFFNCFALRIIADVAMTMNRAIIVKLGNSGVLEGDAVLEDVGVVEALGVVEDPEPTAVTESVVSV